MSTTAATNVEATYCFERHSKNTHLILGDGTRLPTIARWRVLARAGARGFTSLGKPRRLSRRRLPRCRSARASRGCLQSAPAKIWKRQCARQPAGRCRGMWSSWLRRAPASINMGVLKSAGPISGPWWPNWREEAVSAARAGRARWVARIGAAARALARAAGGARATQLAPSRRPGEQPAPGEARRVNRVGAAPPGPGAQRRFSGLLGHLV